MSEMLTAIVGYPGIVTTVLLGVVLAYWLFVMFGALDIDLFGGDGALEGASKGAMDGLADGAIHGAAKGVAEGIADGAADGAVEGHIDGAVEGAAHGHADGAVDGVAKAAGAARAVGHGAAEAADLMSIANFRSVPVTVMMSVVVCFAWLFCVLGSRSLQAAASSVPLPWWLLGTLILVLSFLLALVPTAVAIRPMSRFFVTHQAKRHAELVGKVCVVTTGRVDARFGQASLESDGMSLLIQVRSDHATDLKKGAKALIVSWDDARHAFLVEPYEDVVKSG